MLKRMLKAYQPPNRAPRYSVLPRGSGVSTEPGFESSATMQNDRDDAEITAVLDAQTAARGDAIWVLLQVHSGDQDAAVATHPAGMRGRLSL